MSSRVIRLLLATVALVVKVAATGRARVPATSPIPALEAAGIPPRRIYDLRSTFASQALAAGVSVFELARIIGTSVRMIERHYGTLLQGSGDAIRGKLVYLEGLGQESAAASDAAMESLT